jgi:hypothetical protein
MEASGVTRLGTCVFNLFVKMPQRREEKELDGNYTKG